MEQQLIEILIRDMASEFFAKRRNVSEYVDSRYPDHSDLHKIGKRKQVSERLKMAKIIHQLSPEIAQLIVEKNLVEID